MPHLTNPWRTWLAILNLPGRTFLSAWRILPIAMPHLANPWRAWLSHSEPALTHFFKPGRIWLLYTMTHLTAPSLSHAPYRFYLKFKLHVYRAAPSLVFIHVTVARLTCMKINMCPHKIIYLFYDVRFQSINWWSLITRNISTNF